MCCNLVFLLLLLNGFRNDRKYKEISGKKNMINMIICFEDFVQSQAFLCVLFCFSFLLIHPCFFALPRLHSCHLFVTHQLPLSSSSTILSISHFFPVPFSSVSSISSVLPRVKVHFAPGEPVGCFRLAQPGPDFVVLSAECQRAVGERAVWTTPPGSLRASVWPWDRWAEAELPALLTALSGNIN